MAPEIIEGNPYNRKADVYALGILMFQVVTDSFPYLEVRNGTMKMFQLLNKIVKDDYCSKFTIAVKRDNKEVY